MKKMIFTLVLFSAACLSHAQVLYGTAAKGSGAGYGTICKLDAATNTLTAAFSFDNINGANPYGSLIHASDGKLYGMTNQGASDYGVIFSYDPVTAIFTKLQDFDRPIGSFPSGSLVQASDGKLYGGTSNGGSSGFYGDIFSFDPATAAYTILYNFDVTNGSTLVGNLIQASDGKLYGMTSQGGSSIYYGVIFSYDPATAVYTRLYSFDHDNGRSPFGSLVQASDGKLYGMAQFGGSYNYGVIFSFDPATAVYTRLKDFDGNNGANPLGSLIQASDGKLYGMTSQGGTGKNVGVIFSYNPATATYTNLHVFDGTNGSFPEGSLMQASNGKLYGMTNLGGSNNTGVSFSFDPVSGTYTKLADFTGSNGSNPQYTSFIEVCPTYYRDADGDGFGDLNNSTTACSSTPPAGYVADSSDCDDTKLLYADKDGDGFGAGSPVACGVADNTDCNDKNASAHPKIFYRDADGDSYGDASNSIMVCTRPAGYVTNKRDCNDSNAAVHPGAVEICGNGIDDNCDGRIDEGCALVLITIRDTSILEGNTATRPMKFIVKLSKISTKTITVDYTTQDITATAGSDYIAQSGTLTFAPGIRQNAITIQVTGDRVPEPDEAFEVLLSNPVNAGVSDGTGIGTILNNDGTPASKSIAQNENAASAVLKDAKLSPNPANGKVNVTLTGYSGNVTIQLMDVNGKMLQERKVTTLFKVFQQEMNISNYPNGVYLVTVIDEKGNRKTQKLVISR
jgi:uncharacterized repeat protein (TIGR03803 family)